MSRRIIGPAAWIGLASGLVIGAVAATLVKAGNPGNMGVCIACFVRDTAGVFGGPALGMGGVAYLRPEILGLVLGALASALAGREFRPRGGSAVPVRFVLGFVFMVAALVFLGCTVRAWLRLGGGDLNAAAGIAGLVAGVFAGTLFLRAGFDLGAARTLPRLAGWIGPGVTALLLALAVAVGLGAKPAFLTVSPARARATAQGALVAGDAVLKPAGGALVGGAVVAADGEVVSPAEAVQKAKPIPGGLRAPLWLSLAAGLFLGALAQRSRFCTIGAIRDAILVRRFDLAFGVLGLLLGAFAVNVALGQFKLGWVDQPVAHGDLLGNFAAMGVAGLAAVLMGGCPFRQVIMTGEGDADAAATVLGMIAGALAAHGLGAASSPKGLAPLGWPALFVATVVLLGVGSSFRAARRSAPCSAPSAGAR
jgi:YedE family putative selenium metabolism protein